MAESPISNASMDDVKWRLGSLPNAEQSQFEGCTAAEIAELEKYAGSRLPQCYRQFLESMGRKAGPLFRGSESLLSENQGLRLRSQAESILSRLKSAWSLPQTAFVFLIHQGYQFLFIDLSEGENPPVYLVSDREPRPKQIADCFTAYIDKYTSDLEQLARTRPWIFEPLPGSEEIED